MTAQPDLWHQPTARRTDPVTSHRAADSMREGAAAHRAQIVSLLQDGTVRTHEEIDEALGWPHPRAARRMKELVTAGLVRRATMKPTSSGRQAWAYTA